MKKTLLSLVALIWACNMTFAQDTIVAWTFPSTSADSLVDVSIGINTARYISNQYGTWGSTSYHAILIDYTTNGSLGAPDKCGKSVGWNDGADSAYWMVKFKTTGYGSMKLYSKQQSGGSNPGPRDFKAQYKLPGTTTWVDIVGGTILCANDWTTGVLNGVDLPAACDNQSSQISIRWLQTSNFDINGGTLLATGINKIDDIIVTGVANTAIEESQENIGFTYYPNPNADGNLFIESTKTMNEIKIFNIEGQVVLSQKCNDLNQSIDLNSLNSGMYFIQAIFNDNSSVIPQKLIVQ